MYDELHTHNYDDRTSKAAGHIHDLSGTTTKNPDFGGHVHYMSGYTTENNGHVHYYSIVTSPDIEVDGGHVHFYQSITTLDNGHYHLLYGYTTVYTEY